MLALIEQNLLALNLALLFAHIGVRAGSQFSVGESFCVGDVDVTISFLNLYLKTIGLVLLVSMIVLILLVILVVPFSILFPMK